MKVFSYLIRRRWVERAGARARAMASTVALAGIVSSTTPATSTPAPSCKASSSVFKPALLPIRASSQPADQCSRRALLSLLATAAPAVIYAKEALAAATSIKVGGPPPPSGGLPGTLNADQARDTDLPLKERFYIQALPPQEAAVRAKDCAQDIVNVKSLIDKKAWPYVMNDLRLKASYLRFDLNTIIASKSKAEKKALKSLVNKLFDEINNLDYAARSKSPSDAAKYYATTVSSLNNVLAKIG